MRKELQALREKMKMYGFDAYLIPTTDFHRSEYVHDHFKFREYISGFTGSAGTLVVTMDEAKLWTDGRYFLQAAAQLEGSGIDLMKMGQPGVPTIVEYLEDVLIDGAVASDGSAAPVLAFDGRVCSPADIPEGKFNISVNHDLADEIWPDRPAIVPSEIYALDESVTGEASASKLARLRAVMAEKGADYHMITALDEIAWLYNLRGRDVKHTPVFFAYALITPEEDRLYLMGKPPVCKELRIRPYEAFLDDLTQLPAGKMLLNRDVTSYTILSAIPDHMEIISEEDPVTAMKTIKNPIEIESTKKAHIKDGTAMVNFLYWLKNSMEQITEISAADKLEEFRRRQEGCYDLSFDTISGYGSNGAIIHYSATEKTNTELRPEGLYLVDSGGQYDDGTTDITRTIALGSLTDEMKVHYTAVLRSHIALAMARFKHGTTGAELDAIARKPLQDMGLNYNHGTGHGVGHLLGCHEGPQSISPRDNIHAILPGMINSNEPGVYIEGSHGIRLENEMVCVKCGQLYGFETITFCPFDRDAILPDKLTDSELKWLNDYHRQVWKKISPLVDEDTKTWLYEAIKPLS